MIDPATDRGRSATPGYTMALAAAILWASGATVGKDLFGDGITPLGLAQFRSLVSAVAIALFVLLYDRRLFRIALRDLPLLGGLGAAALAGTQICYFEAVESTQVAIAILLQYMSVVLVFAFSTIVWKEQFTRFRTLAVLCALGGCFLVVGGANLEVLKANSAGIAWGMCAAICFAAYSLGSQRLVSRLSPWTILLYAFAFSAFSCHVADPDFTYLQAGSNISSWGQLVYVALPGTALPFGLYLAAIGRIGASRASITAVSEPLFAAIFAFALLGEVMGPVQMLGGALVIGAIVILRLKDVASDVGLG